MAVCSRIEDYQQLQVKLQLRTALVLQPLSEQQVTSHIKGEAFEGLRDTLADDAELRKLARTPFLLNAMTHAYADRSGASLVLPEGSTATERRNHLLESYVERQIRKDSPRYEPTKFRRILGWLARRMNDTGRLTFHLEDLQREDLPSPI